MDNRSTTTVRVEHRLEVARLALMATTDDAETDRLIEVMASLRKAHRARQDALEPRCAR